MIGSSNFTCAGMGVEQRRNAEANLLSIVERGNYGREVGQIEAIWPEMEQVADPDSAEWLGAHARQRRGRTGGGPAIAGWIPSGHFIAPEMNGKSSCDSTRTICRKTGAFLAAGQEVRELLSAPNWRESGRSAVVELAWGPVQPPEKLLVRWAGLEAFLPLNVEDSRKLPPPAQLEDMSADDMLLILAAADPSAAFRAWAKRQQPSDSFDTDLDSATPVDLDPLRRYDLQATFLHRIRRRARILAQLRSNLQRPVLGTAGTGVAVAGLGWHRASCGSPRAGFRDCDVVQPTRHC